MARTSCHHSRFLLPFSGRYFPPQTGVEGKAPTLIWLQGGPGAASTFGLFAEMGPYVLTPNSSDPTGFNLGDRPTSWNKKYGMIFIDNPVRLVQHLECPTSLILAHPLMACLTDRLVLDFRIRVPVTGTVTTRTTVWHGTCTRHCSSSTPCSRRLAQAHYGSRESRMGVRVAFRNREP